MQRKPSARLKASERRIPQNPKYASVRPQVDSGFNEIKFSEKFDLAKMNARFRRDENFRRLKPSTFAALQNERDIEFLLLDVRDNDEHAKSHIQDALCYPAPMLSRSCNNFTPEILAFSNKEPEKIIIIYDLDERVAVPAGNLFFEKGVDNVFLLSGGLRALSVDYPELIEGELPRPPSPCPTHASVRSSHGSVRSFTSQTPSNKPRPPPSVSSMAMGRERASGAWR